MCRCIYALLPRNGVVDEASAADKSTVNLANVFQLAGLGEFSQALLRADRVITL